MKGWKKTRAYAAAGQCRGFNLYEMMVTMTIGAILLAIALPAFDRFGVNGILVTTTNDLSASFSRARAEAIKARRNVRMCPSSDSNTCDSDANWASGWIMYVDTDRSGSPASGELLQIGTFIDDRVSLTTPGSFSQWLEFRPTGTVLGNAGTTGFFLLCSDHFDDLSRRVGISASGRVSAKKQANLCVGEGS